MQMPGGYRFSNEYINSINSLNFTNDPEYVYKMSQQAVDECEMLTMNLNCGGFIRKVANNQTNQLIVG